MFRESLRERERERERERREAQALANILRITRRKRRKKRVAPLGKPQISDCRVNKNAEKLEHANIFRRTRDRAIPKSLARRGWLVLRAVHVAVRSNLARKKPSPVGDMYMQAKLNIHAVQIRLD